MSTWSRALLQHLCESANCNTRVLEATSAFAVLKRSIRSVEQKQHILCLLLLMSPRRQSQHVSLVRAKVTSSFAVRWPMYLMAVNICSLAFDNSGATLHAKEVQLLYTFV